MNNTSRTPVTTTEYAEIAASLPKSITRRYGYMVETAIMQASRNQTSDHSFDTTAEIAAYNAAYAATVAWMNQ